MIDRFTDAFLAEIKAKVPISEVIGQTVTWDKEKTLPSRGDYWAPCPFHSESTPSFHCEDPKGVYHCFGCGESGDHFEFLTKNQGLSFIAAVERLAELAGVPLPEKSPQPRQERQESVPEYEGPSDDTLPLDDQPAAQLVPVKGYRYTDRDGNPLYEVIRKQWRLPDGSFVIDPKTGNPKKTFRQRHKGPDGAYIDNLDGIAHTIYRHPEVEQAIADGKWVGLVEGEKDVETIEALGFVGTTNSGGAGNWRPDLAEVFRGADVVIMVDNDDVGRKAGEVRATSLRGIASRIRVLDFGAIIPGFPAKNDVSDWAAAGGTAEQLSAIIVQLPDWRLPPPVSHFGAVQIAQAAKASRQHEWLVHDMIELGGTASLAGFTQSGKSFLMIDLAFCVARGKPFWGRDTKQGLVVYQVGEGETGFNKRVEGYLQDRGIDDPASIPMVILPRKINLFVDDKDTEALIKECKDQEAFYETKLRLLVIDTFNKATRGSNEISGQDNGKIIERVERIARECGCTVMVVDHLSAQGRLRGHTSKSDDMANVIKVSMAEKTDRNGRNIRKFVLDKNKDGENGTAVHFVLRQVMVGFDDEGRPITTCVVDAPDGDVTEETRGRLSMGPALLLRAIQDTADIEGQKAPPELVQVPPGRNVAKWADVLARARKTWTFKSSEPDKREGELQRIVKEAGNRLTLAGYIDRDNTRGLIWWTGKTDRPRREPAAPIKPEISAGMREAIDEGVPF